MAQAVSFFNKVTNVISEINKNMKLRAKRKQCYNELSALTTRELKDIGLCRADISAVADDSFCIDSIRAKPMEVNKNIHGWA